MAKKYNRSRPQKRNIDRQKLEKFREEISREPGVKLPGEGADKGASTDINLHRYRNPLI